MANACFGIFFLLTLPLVIFKIKEKSSLELLIFVLAIFSLAASLGESLPVRKWLFQLPLMDLFRFPSAFRILVVIFLLLLTAIQLDSVKQHLKFYMNSVVVFIFLLVSLLIFATLKNYSGISLSLFFTDKTMFNEHSTVYDHIIIQSFIQIILLSIYVLFSHSFKSIKVLYVCILVDVFLTIQLNLPYTSLDYTTKPSELHAKLKVLPDSITHVPSKPIFMNNDQRHSLSPLWKNVQNYRLEIGYDGCNPFELSAYDKLSKSPYFSKIIQNNPYTLPSTSLTHSTSILLVFLPPNWP